MKGRKTVAVNDDLGRHRVSSLCFFHQYSIPDVPVLHSIQSLPAAAMSTLQPEIVVHRKNSASKPPQSGILSKRSFAYR